MRKPPLGCCCSLGRIGLAMRARQGPGDFGAWVARRPRLMGYRLSPVNVGAGLVTESSEREQRGSSGMTELLGKGSGVERVENRLRSILPAA
jgi:hypothetical protein